MSDTTWLPPKLKLPAPGPYLEALGALVLWFNELEMTLYGFFQLYIEHEPARVYLFAELHNAGRLDLLRTYMLNHPDDEFCKAAEYGLRCFDICCDNRNLIAHAFPDYETLADDAVGFVKRVKGKPGQVSKYDFTLDEVRAAALAAKGTQHYLFDLHAWLKAYPVPVEGMISFRPILPKRPPQPRRLNLSRRAAAPADDPPPPQSGGG